MARVDGPGRLPLLWDRHAIALDDPIGLPGQAVCGRVERPAVEFQRAPGDESGLLALVARLPVAHRSRSRPQIPEATQHGDKDDDRDDNGHETAQQKRAVTVPTMAVSWSARDGAATPARSRPREHDSRASFDRGKLPMSRRPAIEGRLVRRLVTDGGQPPLFGAVDPGGDLAGRHGFGRVPGHGPIMCMAIPRAQDVEFRPVVADRSVGWHTGSARRSVRRECRPRRSLSARFAKATGARLSLRSPIPMRLPRMTTRRWMVAVATVGLAMGLLAAFRQRAEGFARLSEAHLRGDLES